MKIEIANLEMTQDLSKKDRVATRGALIALTVKTSKSATSGLGGGCTFSQASHCYADQVNDEDCVQISHVLKI